MFFNKGLKNTFVFLHLEMKGHGSRVNLVKREAKTWKSFEKISVIFSVIKGIHWEIFATIVLCFTTSKCHESVNICK